MKTPEERIGVLESKQETTDERLDELKGMRKDISEIKVTLGQQKSFIAGLTLAATAFGFVLREGWYWLQKSIQ